MSYSPIVNSLSSPYSLKYQWIGEDKNGWMVRLEILEKDANIDEVLEIRGLADIKLNLQGSLGSITAPIVKTSLEFTLVDAPDLVEEGTKAGNWQEFFSPDSTKYLVRLYRYWTHVPFDPSYDDDGADPQFFWQGYITPDAWREGLAYHSGITITARDNLGHLQDFSFDAEGDLNGLISVSDLVDAALTKIAFPFSLAVPISGDASYLKDSDGESLLDSMICVTKFSESNWYEALEKVLEGLGLCLRFYGGWSFVLQPVRNLPLRDFTSRTLAAATTSELRFFNGTRSKDPAFKEIVEIVDFSGANTVEMDLKKNLTIDGSDMMTYSDTRRYEGPPVSRWVTFTGRSFYNGNTDGATQGGWINGYGYLALDQCQVPRNAYLKEGKEALNRGVLLAADFLSDSSTPRPIYRMMKCSSTDIQIKCEFARPIELYRSSSPYAIDIASRSFLKRAALVICYEDPVTLNQYFWDGSSWSGNYSIFSVDIATEPQDGYSLAIPLVDLSDSVNRGGWLDIEFCNFITEVTTGSITITGSFVWLTSMRVELNAANVLKKDTIRTVNNEIYNVKVERKPEIGAMSAVVPFFTAANYPGALWKYVSGLLAPYGYANYWNGANSNTAIPLPAQIHKQLLCFNLEALTVLEGSCDIEGQLLSLGLEFSYKGKHYLLQSGTLDICRIRFTTAIFHEYIWYGDIWNENNNPPYSGAPIYGGKSGGAINTAVIQGTNSAGGGGVTPSGGGVTSVGLTMPAAFNVVGSPITTHGSFTVSLAQGYMIPTTSDKEAWDDAASKKHSHSNKETLDRLAPRDVNFLKSVEYFMLHAAPTVKRFTVQANYEGVLAHEYPFFIVRHPLFDMGITEAEVCLMVYRKRNGNGGSDKAHRKGWFLACGAGHAINTAYAAAATTVENGSVAVPELFLKDGIARTYCQHDNASVLPVDYSDWIFQVANATAFGFAGSHQATKLKHKIHFGLAVRLLNPEFEGVMDPQHELDPDTNCIQGIPRYLYSAVAPLTAHMYTRTVGGQQKGSIVFDLL